MSVIVRQSTTSSAGRRAGTAPGLPTRRPGERGRAPHRQTLRPAGADPAGAVPPDASCASGFRTSASSPAPAHRWASRKTRASALERTFRAESTRRARWDRGLTVKRTRRCPHNSAATRPADGCSCAPAPDEDVQRAGDVAGTALPLDRQRGHGGIDRPGPRFVGDPVALLDHVERRPQVVDRNIGGDGAPRLCPEGRQLAHQADRRAQSVFALLQPRLELPVQALAPSRVVLELLAGHRTHVGVGEMPDRRGQGARNEAVVGIADHHNRSIGLFEAPVERLGLAQPVRTGERTGAGPLSRRRRLGIPVGDHQDLEGARIPIGPEIIDLAGDHPRLPERRHDNRQVGPRSGLRRALCRGDPPAPAASAPRQPGGIEQVAGAGAGHQRSHGDPRPQARPAHSSSPPITSRPGTPRSRRNLPPSHPATPRALVARTRRYTPGKR